MNKLDWTPGEEGKGVVDQHGNVHTFNTDEYDVHSQYLKDHPEIQPHSYFYVEPDGGISITMPHKIYDGKEQHDAMMDHIMQADPLYHPYHDTQDWDF